MKPLTFELAAVKSRLSGGGVLLMRACLVLSLCLCTVSLCLADPAKAAIRKDLTVPAEDLSPALQQVATTYELQVLYPTQVAKDLKTHGAVGSLTSDEALTKVLSGTGLSYKYLDANTVTVFALSSQTSNPAALGVAPHDGDESSKEGKKSSSDQFRVAQVDQGTAGPSAVDKAKEKVSDSRKKTEGLEEVVVTGSRIPTIKGEGAQDVKIYTREQIDQSGQTNISDFLSTLPDVSVASSESGFSTGPFGGGTTVQLHGLPLGTTLILLNGRRIESSGAQAGNGNDIFDLNTIPLGAVERIEVVSEGSSAIYGSDAIAGVVNIILKKNLDGLQADAKFGGASGIDEEDADLAWGHRWDRGSLSIIGTLQTRGELAGSERSVTANASNTATCNPGNVFSLNGSNLPGLNAPFAAVPAGFTGTPTQQEFAATAGSLNQCGFFANNSTIPATRRQGLFASGSLEVSPSVQLFFEAMYSHVLQFNEAASSGLFAIPGFQSYTVSASNPYNPFGETVGVGYLIDAFKRQDASVDSNFFRPLVGARGNFLGAWNWEVAAWRSQDNNSTSLTNNLNATAIQAALNSPGLNTALNPFTTASPGSSQLLQSLLGPNQLQRYSAATNEANGFVRGPLFQLPSGAVNIVIGAEYERDTLFTDDVQTPFAPPNTTATFHRDSYAVFGETRIPILGNRDNATRGDMLAVTIAGRYDNFNDFGSKFTPQFGAEWRPLDSLLIRGTYGKSFKAPPLFDLYSPQGSVPTLVTDPLHGNQTVPVTEIYGGNPGLSPETGRSHAIGLVYSSEVIPKLQLSVTQWEIEENNQIQALPPQTIIDNEGLFPGLVTRDPTGNIVSVNAIFLNFGEIDVAGLDYKLTYRHSIGAGDVTGSASAVQTYHYTAALTPGSPAVDADSKAQTSGNWAPRWKGVLALGWEFGPFIASADGRYVGSYEDYNSTTHEIGNFWLYDFNVRYAIGAHLAPKNRWMKAAYLVLGGVNVFNTLPQVSNSPFGSQGYDPVESDIRGRFLYVRLGVTL